MADLDALLDAVIALPPDTAWSLIPSASWTIWSRTWTRTYRGIRLEVYDESPNGFSWMAWINRAEGYELIADGDAATLALAQLQAERFAEGETGGPATDALAFLEES